MLYQIFKHKNHIEESKDHTNFEGSLHSKMLLIRLEKVIVSFLRKRLIKEEVDKSDTFFDSNNFIS